MLIHYTLKRLQEEKEAKLKEEQKKKKQQEKKAIEEKPVEKTQNTRQRKTKV